MDRTEAAYGLAALLGLVLALQILYRVLAAWLERRRARQRQARALRGERQAEKLLGKLGYTICERQAATTWTITCDGAAHEVSLRADLIVMRSGKRFVAEVKTGRTAPQMTTASTRRQLLEYRVAYQVDGVLLVDVEAARVVHVAFPLPAARPSSRITGWLAIVCALLAGAAAGLSASQWLD